MSISYQAVGWNRQKKVYDRTLLAGVMIYLLLFIGISAVMHPNATAETLLIRGFGTAAIILLHVILAIGPLCRLDRRFLPLLYNRRHMGVTMFILALAHGVLSMIQFHALGDTNPLVSLFTANTQYDALSAFPFQPLGFFALVILFLMAATSHDFWMANLTPPVWKTLHMMVYVAYALLIGHISLGILQAETNPQFIGLLSMGFVIISLLHLLSAAREMDADIAHQGAAGADFVDVCAVADIPMNRAKMVVLSGERVAVFRYEDKISAVSAVCRHQNGPLAEGKIIDGCITCPWHGYQYQPHDGASPPPFTELIPTFNVAVKNGRVLVHPTPNPPGTPVEPAVVQAA